MRSMAPPETRKPYGILSMIGLVAVCSIDMLGSRPGLSLCSAQEKIPSVLNRPTDSDTTDEPAVQARAGVQDVLFARDQLFDFAYQSLGGNKANFEQLFRRRVRLTLNRIDQLCSMSDGLKDKVLATAELERQRLDIDMASIVAEAPSRMTPQQFSAVNLKLQSILQRFQSKGSSVTVQMVFLWQKVLYSQLSSDQLKDVQTDEQNRNLFRQKTQRLETILKLSRRLGLTAVQRKRLETYGASYSGSFQEFESAWLHLQALPESEKREWFTNEQIEELSNDLEQSNEVRLLIIDGGN